MTDGIDKPMALAKGEMKNPREPIRNQGTPRETKSATVVLRVLRKASSGTVGQREIVFVSRDV